MSKKPVLVMLDPHDIDRLKATATREDRSVSAFVRKAVKDALHKDLPKAA